MTSLVRFSFTKLGMTDLIILHLKICNHHPEGGNEPSLFLGPDSAGSLGLQFKGPHAIHVDWTPRKSPEMVVRMVIGIGSVWKGNCLQPSSKSPALSGQWQEPGNYSKSVKRRGRESDLVHTRRFWIRETLREQGPAVKVGKGIFETLKKTHLGRRKIGIWTEVKMIQGNHIKLLGRGGWCLVEHKCALLQSWRSEALVSAIHSPSGWHHHCVSTPLWVDRMHADKMNTLVDTSKGHVCSLHYFLLFQDFTFSKIKIEGIKYKIW